MRFILPHFRHILQAGKSNQNRSALKHLGSGGERVESVPPAPACCPDMYAEEGTSEKAYCLNKKALHVPKLS